MYKTEFCVQRYLINILNRKLRSVIAQLRVYILPLAVETGWWKNTPLEDRKCELCRQRGIEDERHFVFNCEIYLLEQEVFLEEIQSIVPDFDTLNMEEKWKMLMSEICVN